MLSSAPVTVSVKSTFLDFATDEAPPPGGRRRSLPPSFPGPGGASPHQDEAQLLRLSQILSAAPRPSSGLAPRSPTSSLGGDSPGSQQDAFKGLAGAAPAPGAAPVGKPRAHVERRNIGSDGHAAGTCRPCAFARSAAGCKFGAKCTFCHIVEEHTASLRVRPCKGKRERFKRQMATIERAVSMDPDLLADGHLSLPALVDRSSKTRARVMERLTQVAADARRACGQGVAAAS